MSRQDRRQPDGGAPLLGEPLAIEFANTYYAVRGRHLEGIGAPAHLSAWLRANAVALGRDPEDPGLATVGDAEVAEFLTLRDAIRAIAAATVTHRRADPARVATLNRAAAVAPRWPVLRPDGDGYSIIERTGFGAVPAALAAVARDAISIFGGPLRADVRACHAPGCVLFFIRQHPRREWCSAACGNRARAARHYHRHRDQPTDS